MVLFLAVLSVFFPMGQCAPAPDTPAPATAPAGTPSYGTIAASDFSNNLAMINQNMYNGVTGIANPLSKFAIDTAPNLAHLYAIFNGVNVPPFLASLTKNLYGSAAVGGGKLAGGAAVLGSKVAEGSMKVGAHGLQAGGDVVEALGQSGIHLAGKLGDYAASGTEVGADIVASGLKTAGDSTMAGSAGVNVVSQGISGIIDAIGGRLVAAITSAEQTATQLVDSGVKKLENGALQFADKTQERIYQGLVAYLQVLTHVQNIINMLASVLGSVFNLASASGSGLGLSVDASASASVVA